MSEISKMLLKKEREFVERYLGDFGQLTDEQIDGKFDELVSLITENKL